MSSYSSNARAKKKRSTALRLTNAGQLAVCFSVRPCEWNGGVRKLCVQRLWAFLGMAPVEADVLSLAWRVSLAVENLAFVKETFLVTSGGDKTVSLFLFSFPFSF